MKLSIIDIFRKFNYLFLIDNKKINGNNDYTFNIENNGKYLISFTELDKNNLNILININSGLENVEIFELLNNYTNNTNININLEVKSKSKIDYKIINISNMKKKININRNIIVEKFSSVNYVSCNFSKTIKSNTEFILKEFSKVNTNTSLLVSGGFIHEHSLKINHYERESKSFMNNIGIVMGNSIAQFYNAGFIKKGAFLSDAQQISKLITLDKNSQAYIHPILLIDEYNVTAGHAGSVGKFSDEEIYYLESRGLSKNKIYFLLIDGLLQTCINLLNNEELKYFLKEHIYGNIINDNV